MSITSRIQNKGFYVTPFFIYGLFSRQLKGFKKIFLKAGEEKTVKISFVLRDQQIYDAAEKKWANVDGKFTVYVILSVTPCLPTPRHRTHSMLT